ncbi:surfeit locus protein 6 homolog [Topomyia yanbarensis]|uniref:surfeit locus protein 6 homolog n=1 Tax=Topomyia yanbarensis TaxID=2498891 RepID=UPI00273B2D3B|nr:surfeit locus protein 6 homolog [Topomyia yanbarensis]XP_058821421.1 surfeit locus protein 6 homolog [Topomyia yanbarensis]XP_058821422.1 surfeit locus protein 6 homolog [Topomyia yanbarensis]
MRAGSKDHNLERTGNICAARNKPDHDRVMVLAMTNRRYAFLLDAFQIPSTNSDDNASSVHLLENKLENNYPKMKVNAETEHKTRLEVMQNKINSKCLNRKRKPKLEGKLLRKQILKKYNVQKMSCSTQDIKHHPEKLVKQEKDEKLLTYNKMGKIMFSKIQLDENDIRKEGIETDTKKLLKQVLDERGQLNNLKLSGETEKYAELKSKKSWERATAKALGRKVKDNIGRLSTKVQRRKNQIAKSKQEWTQRIQKNEHVKSLKQKKRLENIRERAIQKKNKKKAKLVNEGRITSAI